MNIDPQNPYAAPATDSFIPQSVAERHLPATLGQRFGGAFLDGLITVLIMGILVGIFVALGFFGESWILGMKTMRMVILTGFVSFGMFVLVQFPFLKATGQTIGKKAMKTKIVTLSGEKPSMADLILKRYAFMHLIRVIPFAGKLLSLINILCVFGKDRSCIHDMVAGTKVVQTQSW